MHIFESVSTEQIQNEKLLSFLLFISYYSCNYFSVKIKKKIIQFLPTIGGKGFKSKGDKNIWMLKLLTINLEEIVQFVNPRIWTRSQSTQPDSFPVVVLATLIRHFASGCRLTPATIVSLWQSQASTTTWSHFVASINDHYEERII